MLFQARLRSRPTWISSYADAPAVIIMVLRSCRRESHTHDECEIQDPFHDISVPRSAHDLQHVPFGVSTNTTCPRCAYVSPRLPCYALMYTLTEARTTNLRYPFHDSTPRYTRLCDPSTIGFRNPRRSHSADMTTVTPFPYPEPPHTFFLA